jgi:hypothetical protein
MHCTLIKLLPILDRHGAYSIHGYLYKVIETFSDFLIRIGPWNIPCSNTSTEAVRGLLDLAGTARKCSKAALMKPSGSNFDFSVISRHKYMSGNPVVSGRCRKPGPRSPTG